jgi:hypothetical protein
MPIAMSAIGITSIQFCKNVYGNPGPFFLGKPLIKAQELEALLRLISSAERWSGNPEPTNMRHPNGWGATETGIKLAAP